MNSNGFRKELEKIMPGYKWTVHRSLNPEHYLDATGIQTSGFNRLSTLYVIRREKDKAVKYEVKSSGYGTRSPWLYEFSDGTLARALRGLQKYYEDRASVYARHAYDLKIGRKALAPPEGDGGMNGI